MTTGGDIYGLIPDQKVSIKASSGTYTLRVGHGVSDPIPFDADSRVVQRHLMIMGERDLEVAAMHTADPELAKTCSVCNPPPAPEPIKPVWWERTKTKVAELGDRLWYAKEALLGRYRDF